MMKVRVPTHLLSRSGADGFVFADAFSFFTNAVAKPLEGEEDDTLATGSATGADTPKKTVAPKPKSASTSTSTTTTTGPPKKRARRTPAQMAAAREAGEPLRLPKKKKVAVP